MILGFVLSLAFAIGLCVHVVRTGQDSFWLWIILIFQPLGGVVYAVAILLPSLLGGTTARRAASAARDRLDPERTYRAAQAALKDADTVANKAKLARAAAGLGRWDEAEAQYRAAAYGIHADDPALLLGRAQALLELDQAAEALEVLERLGRQEEGGRTAEAALAMARAYQALGRHAEADRAYGWAAERLPGLEGLARYAAFLAETGRATEAREALAELEHRAGKTRGPFAAEARRWRDLAARSLPTA